MTAHQYNKPALAILLCLLMLMGMYFYVDKLRHGFHTNNFGTAELIFHYRKAQSEEFCQLFDKTFVEVEGVTLTGLECKRYPPLFHWIARPFAFNQPHFYLFSLIIICLLIPGILLIIKKHWVSVLFYWSVSFPYMMEFGFHYSQVIATAMLLIFIWRKEWWIRIPLLLLSILAHTFAPFLLIGAWILELALNKKTFFPGIVFSNGLPKILETPIGIWKNNQFTGINLGYLLNAFFKATPIPFIAFALKQFWKQRQYYLIALFTATTIGMVLVKGRVFETGQIILLLGLTDYYKQANKKMKYGLIILAVLSIALQLLTWRYHRIGTFTQ